MPVAGWANGARAFSPLRPLAEAARSPPPGGTKGAADRRRAGDGAVVARPGPGSAPRRWRQRSAGRDDRRRAKERVPVAGWANGARSFSPLRPARAEAARSPPPGGTKGAADCRRAGDGGALVARPGPGPRQGGGAKEASAEMTPAERRKRPAVAATAMGCALSRRFGGPPKRPGARRRAGPELRRCDGGAVVARPGPGSAPNRWRQGSAGDNGPRRAKERPARGRIGKGACPPSPLRRPAEAARSPPPGGTRAPPLRRRSSGSATRPRVRLKARGPGKRWYEWPPRSETKRARRGTGGGAPSLAASASGRSGRPANGTSPARGPSGCFRQRPAMPPDALPLGPGLCAEPARRAAGLPLTSTPSEPGVLACAGTIRLPAGTLVES